MKVKVISLPYIFQVLYVLRFTRPSYQVSVYRTIGPLVYLNVYKKLFTYDGCLKQVTWSDLSTELNSTLRQVTIVFLLNDAANNCLFSHLKLVCTPCLETSGTLRLEGEAGIQVGTQSELVVGTQPVGKPQPVDKVWWW